MANISLITYAGQTVTPLDDALVYETAINKSGMIYGGVVTIKNANNLHISGGHGMVCGRKFTIFDSDIQVALSSSGTLLGRLYVQLDLSNIGTPIQLLVETGASLTPVQQDQNVNIQNGVYEFNLATFSVDTSTISNLVNVAPSAEPSTGAGSIITVTTAEASLKGKMCTLTDGVNTLNANFDNTGTVVFYGVQMVGTVIVNATDGTYYASSQITITYFGKYSTSLAFWGATVNLTTSTADFYGQTIEVTQDGIAVGSTAFDGAGSATYIAPAAGTYVFTVTYGGNDYSATVVVTAETTYTAVINNGFILADWLSAGGVTGTYADLAAVLADEEAVRQLMTIHAAVDYLASFDSTDTGVVTILNDNYAAKWISLTDYAMDTLEAAYGTLMGTIGKYGYGEWGITDATTTPPTWGALGNVPVMTSNTAPYGECISGGDYASNYTAWKAFDGDDTTYWMPTSGQHSYIGYRLTSPQICKMVKIKQTQYQFTGSVTCVIQGSNDGTNWTDISDDFVVTASQNLEASIPCTSDTAYEYIRFYVKEGTYLQTNNNLMMNTLQFYGRTLKVSVPKMSGNTTPYGEASMYHPLSTGMAYIPFSGSGSSSTYAQIENATNTDVGRFVYEFSSPVAITMVTMQDVALAYDANLTGSIQYSDDGTTWTDTNVTLDLANTVKTAVLSAIGVHKYWGMYFNTGKWLANHSAYSVTVTMLQFYGKDYSEREWDTSHPRRYLYDHGVELSAFEKCNPANGWATITGATGNFSYNDVSVKKADRLFVGAAGQKLWTGFGLVQNVDLTQYSKVWYNYKPVKYNNDSNRNIQFYTYVTATKDQNNYISQKTAGENYVDMVDVSSVNQSAYISLCRIGSQYSYTANGEDGIYEVWLE